MSSQYPARRNNRRRSHPGRRYYDMKNFRHSRERTSSGQAQALWTFFIGIAVAFIALSQISPQFQSQPKPEAALHESPEAVETPQLEAQNHERGDSIAQAPLQGPLKDEQEKADRLPNTVKPAVKKTIQ